jgi:hypothetical protein
MSPEEQRVAIAVHCGYIEPFHLSNEYEETGGPDGDSCFFDVLRDARDCRIPDYLKDLNAMHNAVAFIAGQKFVDYYRMALVEIVGGTLYDAIDATAAQRAEAFLKTLDKWKD